MADKAILWFCIGEMYWEFARFAPYFIWRRNKQYKNRKDVDFIIMTKPDNFDIYGKHASLFVPFKLKDESKYKPECFRFIGMSQEQYKQIIEIFKRQFSDRYKILETIAPDISSHQYVNKKQFPMNKMMYDYQPRSGNLDVIEKYINNKSFVVLGTDKNWKNWNELLDLIWENKRLREKYNFIICGKEPDYVSDSKFRFLDINKFEQNMNSSLIGLTIECLKKAVLTVGSQSTVPNMSLLFGVSTIEWGHQKYTHVNAYNVRKTKLNYIEDINYNIEAEKVYAEIIKTLK